MILHKLPDILKHRWQTLRQFKQDKRREMRSVFTAMDALRMGCAYLPTDAYREVCNARDALARAQSHMSVERWGR